MKHQYSFSKEFIRNINGVYGSAGKQWLEQLPELITKAANKWGLTNLNLYPKLTYNCVLKGQQFNGQLIVLKLRCDAVELAEEVHALQVFQGDACVELLDYDLQLGAMVLALIEPGTILDSLVIADHAAANQIAITLLTKLQRADLKFSNQFKHLDLVLPDLKHDFSELKSFLPKARKLRENLFSSDGRHSYNRLLHGDFHSGNILKNQNQWCVIDPQGYWGDIGYDLAVFMRNPLPELIQFPHAKKLMEHRLKELSSLMYYPLQRLYDWTYLQATIAAYWSLSDGLPIIDYLAFLELFTGIDYTAK